MKIVSKIIPVVVGLAGLVAACSSIPHGVIGDHDVAYESCLKQYILSHPGSGRMPSLESLSSEDVEAMGDAGFNIEDYGKSFSRLSEAELYCTSTKHEHRGRIIIPNSLDRYTPGRPSIFPNK